MICIMLLSHDWFCANRLSLNAGNPNLLYLGLPESNWKAHISELSKKLSRAVGMLCKIKSFCTPSVLKSLYYSLFDSHLAYGLVVWG